MSARPVRALDFSTLPVIESMDMFIRLDRGIEARLAELFKETRERADASLMFFFQTSEKDDRWRNDARLRAGLNEFFSLEAAAVRDLRGAGKAIIPPRLCESLNPLVHLMYILRHVGVHCRPVPTGVAPITVVSDYNNQRLEHSYGEVVLESLAVDDLLRTAEVKGYYRRSDLESMVNWLTGTQNTFGIGEVFRRGVGAYCCELIAAL